MSYSHKCPLNSYNFTKKGIGWKPPLFVGFLKCSKKLLSGYRDCLTFHECPSWSFKKKY